VKSPGEYTQLYYFLCTDVYNTIKKNSRLSSCRWWQWRGEGWRSLLMGIGLKGGRRRRSAFSRVRYAAAV